MKTPQGNQRKRRPSRHRGRMIFVQAILFLALGAVVYRIGFVQSAFGPTLTAKAQQVEDNSKVVLAQRGAILDRSGDQLAYDVPGYMLDIKSSDFSDLATLAGVLAKPLGSTQSHVLAVLKQGTWVRWPNPILATQKDAVMQAVGADHQADVTFTPTEVREYPYNTFAANAIGYVSHAGTGVNGMEAEYNKELSGTNGKIAYTQDRYGFPIQTTVHTVKQPVPGDDLETTLDAAVQGFVEQQMDALVKKYNPEHAAIIVTNPQNGDILAMASRPTYNPNQYWTASSTALNTNWALDASFEPGSTFKILTLAAALATNTINLNQTFTSGHTVVAGHTIYDWNRVGWNPPTHVITFLQALEDSSNVGFAKIALKLGWPNLLHYMRIFGYLNPTGVDLPGEATSQTFGPGSRNTLELATSGFGQGVSVTPLQQVAAIGAIANGGKLIQPHLAKALVDPSTGKVVKTFQAVVKNPQVVPKSVIEQVNHALVLDVSQGIDGTAAIPGYQVAGKTGTANTVDPKTGKYYTNRFIVSFIGYAPASNPQFEIYVTLDYPKAPIDNTWGSTIATPAAQQILQECLQYAHIPPDDPTTEVKANPNKMTTKDTKSQMVTVPTVVGSTATRAAAVLKQAGLTGEVAGSGGTVEQQWPAAGQAVASGSKVVAWTKNTASQPWKMPDVTGMSLRDALQVVSAMGLVGVPTGAGNVTAQSVSPGAPVAAGTSVHLTCHPATTIDGAALNGTTNTSASNGQSGKG